MKQKIILMILIVVVFSMFSNLALAQEKDGEVLIISLLNQDPDPAITGEIVEVRLGIQNIGNEPSIAYTIEALPEYPFEAVP